MFVFNGKLYFVFVFDNLKLIVFIFVFIFVFGQREISVFVFDKVYLTPSLPVMQVFQTSGILIEQSQICMLFKVKRKAKCT